MLKSVENLLCQVCNAQAAFAVADIQTLWSGYGQIRRFGLIDSNDSTVIVKHVQLPDLRQHPRGWNTDLSHQRKLRSYQVEAAFYQHWVGQCDEQCRVPKCFTATAIGNEFLIVMEDLDQCGFEVRKETVSIAEMMVCLTWLAHFHATFMNRSPEQLWPIGTYWHLATRPDELAVLSDEHLKSAACMIDQTLSAAHYQTLVHGDAKLANFCFSACGSKVAAVDFQYVGGGCGMKDVAYFIGSCLTETDCQRHEQLLLDHYFSSLRTALLQRQPSIDSEAVEIEWRELYAFAWADFHRFMKGWSPSHWKIHRYSEAITRQVVDLCLGVGGAK